MSCVKEKPSQKKLAVAVGNFDGLHRGHRLLLDELRRLAEERGLMPAVVTFNPHPLALVNPAKVPKALQTPQQRRRELEALGFRAIELVFDDELRHLSAEGFMRMLSERLDAALLLLGHDNRFGYRAPGKTDKESNEPLAEQYRRLALPLGMDVVPAPELPGISSSVVRKALAGGNVEDAAAMLGHPYALTSIVEHGKHLGHTIGFPTANLLPPEALQIPAPGVYLGIAATDSGKRFSAMVNIGRRPTVDVPDAPLSIEAHLDGFSGDLYQKLLTVEFYRRLRGEVRFDSVEALRGQLSKDLTALRMEFS